MMQKKKSSAKLIGWLVSLLLLLCGTALFCAATQTPAVGTAVLSPKKVTGSAASVTWKTTGNADGYLVYQYNYQTKSYDRIGATTKTAYTFKHLEGGESYLFAVRPYVQSGKSLVKGKIAKLKCYTPLSAVKTIKQTSADTTSHQLQWTAVSGADLYQIYYFKDSEKKFTLLGSTTKTTAAISKLKPTSVYRYKIRAVSICGDKKKIKAAASAAFTAYTRPDDVTRFTAGNVTSVSYELEWSAVDGAEGYRIYRFDENKGKYAVLANVQGTSYAIRGLEPCSTAYYKICAYATLAGKQRFGKVTAALSLTTKPETTEPYLIAPPAANGNIKIGWKPGTCDGYLIYACSTENGSYQLVGQVDAPDTTSYTFRSPFDTEQVYVRLKTYITVEQNHITSAFSSALEIG